MRELKLIGKRLSLGLLFLSCVEGAWGSTDFNLSTGTATYTIVTDTISESPDSGYTGTAIDVTSLPASPYTHATSVTDGTHSSTQWVGPAASQSSEGGGVSGNVTYTVQFDLTGYDFSTASLIMDVAADDFVSSITLNTTNIFTAAGTQITGGMWGSGTSVGTITSGFIAGLNTITFVVDNSTGDGDTGCCGPTGLIVAADVTANASSAPEPATLGLTGLCLAGLGFVRRRRQS